MRVIEAFWVDIQAAFDAIMSINSFDTFVSAMAGLIWSPLLIILCLSAGLYFSFRMKFFQIRKIKKMVELLFGGSSSDQGVSSFQAFALAVAGRVGTGNIVGVATAIAYGGPGALFWMWCIAFFGAGSAFVESTLAQLYKEEIDGEYRGGPAYYFNKMGYKPVGIVFMFATLLACGVLLPGVQSNSIGVSMNNAFGINPAIPVVVVIILLAIIIIGGTKSLSKAAEIIVPFMSGAYILIALIILIVNIDKVPGTFGLIFSSAFGANEVLGGSLGMAILWGVKRGVFSNEAGQGTGAHAAAAAEVSHPAKQGLVQSFSVYFDTLFVCTATGLMIIITGMFSTYIPYSGVDGVFQTYAEYSTMGGDSALINSFTPSAIDTLVNGWGTKFVAIALFFFAFTTLMAYYYYAETNLELLLEKQSDGTRKAASWVLKILFLLMTGFFGLRANAVAWNAADVGVGLMAWINIIGILVIAKPALLTFKDFERRQKAGTDDEFFTVEALPAEDQPYFKGVTFWHEKA
ncbi:AGCS family alanine or glycine:cation symporter [Bacilli bacterium PM5-9]|nr:AGCS family alanine or glycine:cation symporter [Bacilli bacterium PM5-9]